jgi:predicted ribosome quality control (RQC) complex YloA/Tae2 family protein
VAKEEMNAFDVRAVVRELKAFQGARLDKAYEPRKGELLLRARAPARDGQPARKLDVSIVVGKALHLTTLPRENPESPTSFVMQLRKHLANGFVDEVRQHHFDRIVELVFNRKDGRYVLVVELFHDGNVVLVKDDRILVPLMHQSWSSRQVRPGADYVPPPSRTDPFAITAEEFAARVQASTSDAVRTLATELNLGGQYAEEVCARAGVPKNKPVVDLSRDDIDALLASLRALLDRVDAGALDPVVVRKGDEKVDVAPFPLAAHEGRELERFPTFNEALDAYFGKAVTVERVDPRLKKLEEEKQKVQRMLDAQKAAVSKFEREDEESRVKGDILYGHFDTAQRVAQTLMAASKSVGWDAVVAKLKEGKAAKNPEAMLVEQVSPNEGTATLALDDADGKKVRVRVDLRKSVQENADEYYERSKKMREKRKGALVAMQATEARMKDLIERGVELVAAIEEKQSRLPPTKRLWFEQWRWFYTSDDHLVLAGRDVRSNEKLVAKQLEDNDRYLHADVSGAPSVVVKAKEGQVSEAALEEAACFAASNSRIWNAGHAAGEAYWVTPAQVSKTPNPGEYVAKGAFIVRGKRNFVRVPIRLAVGEVELDGHRKIMGGPVQAVAARATRYVVLVPGGTPTNQLANRLSQAFGVPVEEVQAVMPPAGVEVVETHGEL